MARFLSLVFLLCVAGAGHAQRSALWTNPGLSPRGLQPGGQQLILRQDMSECPGTAFERSCGRHDTIGGCCSAALNRFRYNVGYQPNCRDNFLRELAKYGMGAKDLVANVNFFMYVPVGANGEMDMGPSISKAGDHVELRAESDVLAVISNCPQINNPVNDYNPTPIRVVVSSSG